MALEDENLDPLVEQTCVECGAALTEEEIRESRDSGGEYLCSVHAAERAPIEDEELAEEA